MDVTIKDKNLLSGKTSVNSQRESLTEQSDTETMSNRTKRIARILSRVHIPSTVRDGIVQGVKRRVGLNLLWRLLCKILSWCNICCGRSFVYECHDIVPDYQQRE